MPKSGLIEVDESTCNATAMRKASRRLSSMYDEALMPCGLKSTQHAILSELIRRRRHPPTMRELADALIMDRSGLGHNLRPLERSGFIDLRTSHEDRRRRHVVLTPVGICKFDEAKRLWSAAQRRFDRAFGKDKAADLRSTLLQIAKDERLGVGIR
ncbi:MarR family winged helix-turn-helix transcriptional regulator [Beijerinckia sp. L45]|uniref:MarR family winged helix-turn-helix transcriptional regulator n=1 Tax=Beijerinckia sp. L45 TaxID=1641855 RepID=UPI001AEE4E7C|nr:MarR family transcriptional regulator [Beijerinckia sp. L45]